MGSIRSIIRQITGRYNRQKAKRPPTPAATVPPASTLTVTRSN